MPKKLKLIYQALSLVTLLEGVVGVLIAGFEIFHVPKIERLLGSKFPHFALAFYCMDSANLLFNGLLIVAGVLLWRMRRRGLFLLFCTFAVELIYFIAFVAIAMDFKPRPVADTRTFADTLTAAGGANMSLAVQAFTGYPVVALVLVFLAYRYLGLFTFLLRDEADGAS